MASILDFANFTFTAEQIRDINELVFDEILHAPDLNFIHSMFSGIKYDKEIGFIGASGLVGVAHQGCDPEPQDWNVNTRKVTWTPKEWEILIEQCATDLDNTAAVYCRNEGINMDDLTDTDYFAILVIVLTNAVKDFLYRLVWFNDVDAENASNSGIITNGVATKYFTILDGFFKQLQTAVTQNTNLLVTIDRNSKTTKKEQMAMTGDEAYAILEEMYYNAPIEMRQSGNMRFLVTQSIADAYQKYLTGMKLESTYTNLVDGVKSLKFLGIDVIPMPIWDKMIQSYNDLGTTYFKPHRAVLIEQGNLAVGTPETEAFDGFRIWYENKSRKNYIETMGKADAKLLNDTRLVFAQ